MTPGTDVTFRVEANGTDLMYQWRRGQDSLTDTAKFLGTTTPELTITDIEEADEGGYSCLVQNDLNNISSRVANLTVCEYSINTYVCTYG